MRDLNKLKTDFKDLATEDLSRALIMLKEHLKPDTELYDEFLSAIERCNRTNKALNKGLISFEEADIFFNRVFNFTIVTVNYLKQEDLLP